MLQQLPDRRSAVGPDAEYVAEECHALYREVGGVLLVGPPELVVLAVVEGVVPPVSPVGGRERGVALH